SGPRTARRHAKSCCGLSPCRRATSDTLASGSKLSNTMRTLSSLDQRRRRPVPVISSSRRTPSGSASSSAGLVSSLCSSLCLKRSLMGRHYATSHNRPERGGRTPLTIQHGRNAPDHDEQQRPAPRAASPAVWCCCSSLASHFPASL